MSSTLYLTDSPFGKISNVKTKRFKNNTLNKISSLVNLQFKKIEIKENTNINIKLLEGETIYFINESLNRPPTDLPEKDFLKVWKISHTDTEKNELNYSWKEVKKRCDELGLKSVDYFKLKNKNYLFKLKVSYDEFSQCYNYKLEKM